MKGSKTPGFLCILIGSNLYSWININRTNKSCVKLLLPKRENFCVDIKEPRVKRLKVNTQSRQSSTRATDVCPRVQFSEDSRCCLWLLFSSFPILWEFQWWRKNEIREVTAEFYDHWVKTELILKCSPSDVSLLGCSFVNFRLRLSLQF